MRTVVAKLHEHYVVKKEHVLVIHRDLQQDRRMIGMTLEVATVLHVFLDDN